MNILEAYELTLQKVEELKTQGIEVRIKPTNSQTVEKENRLPKDKWINVKFFEVAGEELDKVFKAGEELLEQGISFDTGYGFGPGGGRDWELDWSFHITNNKE